MKAEPTCALGRNRCLAHAYGMSFQDSGVTALAIARVLQPRPNFFRVSQLRRLRECRQVAAVCYRVRSSGIEFLLVQTRGGRWTFPKGSVEPGLTQAQAAALEAFEEAGVHGRMQEASFARYIRRKRRANSAAGKLVVNAFLCAVLWLGAPQESGRNRTWFSAEKAKRQLGEHRAPDYAAGLARVIDRAVTRIQLQSARVR
jgi:8-oxo-dGTP pyrophosphatase MutT (NUDIX family)